LRSIQTAECVIWLSNMITDCGLTRRVRGCIAIAHYCTTIPSSVLSAVTATDACSLA
jgi:hypothetical protein